MKFKTVLKEAAAEVVGAGAEERINAKVGDRDMDAGELRANAPACHRAIMKAIAYAKKTLKFDLSIAKQPADVTIMGNGDVIIVDDKSEKKVRVTGQQLGLDAKTIKALKAEISK